MFITSNGEATNNAFSGNHGTGAYSGTAVTMVIDVIEVRGGFELQRHTNQNSSKIKYKLFWDGECISTIENEKEARSLLNDFCPAPAKRGRPKKAA